ncbi:MAG: thioredoxin domain-containing protein [Bryobacterales bacterium]
MEHRFTNALVHESSPYLLQHAHNPVNWHAWGEEALRKARNEGKLIFLSIGYAACHWCHVMEHESFESEDVAEVLNRDFVSIKVDREERPDLDEIYMTATMLYSGGHGGWPMSVFLTPELQPVYAGTYFPKENAHGRPGFKTLLAFLSRSWNENRESLMTDSRKVVDAVRQIHGGGDQGDLVPREVVTQAVEQIWRAYDREQGGLASGSNKFPPSLSMDLLLREYLHSGYEPYRNAVELTLERMGNGGIYDHLGGGLCRYSTDTKWLVPHFEKMLYDQGLVASIYVDAWQATEREELKQLFSDRARGICDYVLRDLRSPDGAFYSSEDADSEGLEGKFYIWTLDEVKEKLGDDAGRIFASHYDVGEFGNWAHPGDDHVPHGPKSILQVARSAETIAKLNHLDAAEVARTIEESRQKLYEARQKRVRPGLDDKILCGWNGLMITALAKAAAVLDEPRYEEAAAQAAEFILGAMRQEGRLLASYGKGQARLKAYSTDYAFFIEGLLALFESSGGLRWLTAAGELADTMIEHYWDAAGGGFYFTAADHEELLVRSKTANDGAIPSGNSVMLMNLQKLATFLDRGDLRAKAEKIIRAFGASVPRTPFQHERLLCGIEAWHQGFEEIVIAGADDDPATRALLRTVYNLYLPNKVVARVDPSDEKAIKGLPLLAGKTLVDGKPAAYVCRNYACQKPVTEPLELRSQLLNAAKASA